MAPGTSRWIRHPGPGFPASLTGDPTDTRDAIDAVDTGATGETMGPDTVAPVHGVAQ
jgi:hypothetical protein